MVEMTSSSNAVFEYFAEVDEYLTEPLVPYSVDRPSGLWRKGAAGWEYLSLIDWQWHGSSVEECTSPPSGGLYPITESRAAELRSDRQGFVRYWMYYHHRDEWRDGEPPTSVARSRRSPEDICDEVFGLGEKWIRTEIVFEFFDYRGSGRPHLIEIPAAEADALIFELRGITGAVVL